MVVIQHSNRPLFKNRVGPKGVALLYAGFAALWILASGLFLNLIVDDPVLQGKIELGKGLLFVAVTGGLLYQLVKWNQAKLQRLTRLYATLSQCNQAIVRSTSTEQLFPQICRDAVLFGSMKMVWIGMIDDASGLVQPVASFGAGVEYLDGIRISLDANDSTGQGPTGIAIRDNLPVWCQDFQNDPRTLAWHERGVRFGWRASASLPLHRNGVAIGALTLYAGEAHAFDEDERNLLVEMAMDISFALDNFDREVARIKAEQALRDSEVFNQTILNSLVEHIAVLDPQGVIVTVNLAWQRFAEENGAPELVSSSIGLNYLDICVQARNQPLGKEADDARAGILSVLSGEQAEYVLEYPCHSGDEQRWFIMHVSPLEGHRSGVVVAHENITVRRRAVEKLRESEARYSTLFENNSVAMLLVDPSDGRIVDANSSAATYYGWSRGTLQTMNIGHINTLPPDALQETIKRVRDSGQGKFQFRHRLSNNEVRDVEVFTGRVFIDGNSLILSCVIDISERKQAEQQVRSAQALIRRFLDHLPGTAYIKSRDLRVLMASQGFQTYLGIDPATLVGKTNQEMFPGEFGEKINVDDRRVLETGHAETIEEEFQGRYFESIKFAIDDEAQGRMLGGITLEITERHLLTARQQALLEIKELSVILPERALLEHGLGIAEQLTGSDVSFLYLISEDQKTDELVTRRHSVHSDSGTKHQADYSGGQTGIWADSLLQKKPVICNDYAAGGIGKDEHDLPKARVVSVPVIEDDVVRMIMSIGNKASDYNGADVVTLQLIGNDLWRIARRKRVEAELQEQLVALQTLNQKLEDTHNQLVQSEKLAAIGQLAAGIAHEINNPISFIQSNFGSLTEYVEGMLAIDAAYSDVEQRITAQLPQAFEQVNQIKQQVGHDYIVSDLRQLVGESRDGLARVSKIVHDLKDFSRVGETDWQWVDLHQGLGSTLNIVRSLISQKIHIQCQYGQLPLVHCIPVQINQVFLNLIINAAQSIDEQGQISILTACDEHQVQIEVRDTGKGIPAEILKRIFEPFFTTKPVGKGTGLGLSLSWGIVQRHRGWIEVNSEEGQGSVFRVILPVDPLAQFAGEKGLVKE